jgi:DNA-binding transcriptional ArsR family regulator
MSNSNDLERRVLELEQRIDRLEQRRDESDVPDAINDLMKQVADRIEENGIDIESQPAGQANISILVQNKGGKWGFEESFELETLMTLSSESVAKSIGGLSHPVRLDLFKALLSGPKESADLLKIADLNTTGQLYHHLQIMAEVGLVERRSRNLWAAQNLGVYPLLACAGKLLATWRGEETKV